MRIEQDIFKKGSTTYFFSSKFFPKNVRVDVFRLYSFVRVADDYVDCQPVQKEQFVTLRKAYITARDNKNFDTALKNSDSINERVIKNIVHLSRMHTFDAKWLDAFLNAMQSDLGATPYKTLRDSLQYVHGSAEVIGLMMARIMGLPRTADKAACMQGRAMQWLNFIRDIKEDITLGRCYFPANELRKFNLKNLDETYAKQSPDNFKKFMQFQIERYRGWQHEAGQGFKYIPKRLLVPLKTAVGMYDWTAEQIQKDPFIVYERAVKPKKRVVIGKALTNIIH